MWNRKGQSRVVGLKRGSHWQQQQRPRPSSSHPFINIHSRPPRILAGSHSPRPPESPRPRLLLMQLGESRPSSVLAQAGNWQPRSLMDPGPSSSSSSSAPPPSSFLPSTSLSQRRRSSAAHAPPPAPPPTQPIPSVPIIDTTPPDSLDRLADYDDGATYNGIAAYNPFVRPAVSPGLAAVAAFSQARLAAASQPAPPAPYYHNGLDSPPHHPVVSSPPQPQSAVHHQDIIPDRLLLSPPDQGLATEPRPSSRRALTRALELAREAVNLDSTNNDPHGAVVAYGKSVALLSKVMERVMRGEDSTESNRRRGGRRRSVVAQEEEVKRLKAIVSPRRADDVIPRSRLTRLYSQHDTYADRMNILSVIYHITPIPHSPTSLYAASMSASTDTTQPSSPVSGSPDSDSSVQTSVPARANHSLVPAQTIDTQRYLEDATVRLNGGDIFPMDDPEPEGKPSFARRAAFACPRN